jgi:hypothetical protein
VDADKVMSQMNPFVVWVLESPCHGLLSRGLMVMKVQGIRSGMRYSFPVGYQRQGDELFVLVSKAPRKKWWRNFRQSQTVEIVLRGKICSGVARLENKNTENFQIIVRNTFNRVPGLARQFGLKGYRGELSKKDWEIVRSQTELVVVGL